MVQDLLRPPTPVADEGTCIRYRPAARAGHRGDGSLGNFGWNPALPAWLFHAQVPPPDFTFDPSLPGITWVDLVFPFFLFSMGAAFPFSLGRKLDRGVRPAAIVGGILRRGVLLAFFAVALGNLSMWRLNEVLPQPALRALLTLAVWGGYFALFIRLPALSKRRNDLLNACGAAWLVAMMLLYRRLGVPVSVERSDIIILVLANVVVAGSFVWWATRRRPLARLGVVALLVALKIGASVPGSWNETLWNASFAPWLYRAEFMKYLCIVLPGSIAGDLVARWLARRPEAGERPANPVRTYLAAGARPAGRAGQYVGSFHAASDGEPAADRRAGRCGVAAAAPSADGDRRGCSRVSSRPDSSGFCWGWRSRRSKAASRRTTPRSAISS